MSTTIRIVFSNGDTFDVEAEHVAHARAEYYARKDSNRNPKLNYKAVYNDEFAYTMGDDDELLDWINNKMNWSDLSSYALKVEKPDVPFNHQAEFSYADIEVIR
jgi:hypothetical protein